MISNSANPQKLYKSQTGYLKAMAFHRADEAKITPPFETKEIDTSAGKTYIRLIGPPTGEPVFLWHGLGAHGGT